MTYSESLDYLYSQLPMFQRQGPKAFKKDLNNIVALADWLQNPQQHWPCIHVAGTNGKGTTSHMMAAMLQAAGYKVGLYTSPHYKDFRERIKINGELMTKNAVKKFVSRFRLEASHIEASFFEITVAMAFEYFKDQEVDIAVIETGLGGRLDSTNIVNPLLSVITNISLDHTNFLGNTLELIAAEKAGIIKQDKSVVIGRRQKKTKAVFETIARNKNSKIIYAEDVVHISDGNDNQVLVKYLKNDNEYCIPNSNMPFYEENIRTAIAAIILLNAESQFEVDEKAIKQGVQDLNLLTFFIGRWMIFNETPLTIGDSAHNLDGLTSVIAQVKSYGKRHIHFVLGFVNDKDLAEVLALFPLDASYYFAKANIPRGLEAKKLQDQANVLGLLGKTYSSVRNAFAAARTRATDDDLIYIGGSIFTLAEVID